MQSCAVYCFKDADNALWQPEANTAEQCRPTTGWSEALTAAVSQWWPGLLLDQERRVSDVTV